MDYDYAGIRKARRAAGITQEELAKQLEINRATVSKYESGAIDLSLGQLQKIAKILNTAVYEMVNPDWKAIDISDSFASDRQIMEKFERDNDQKAQLEAAYNRLNADGQRIAAAAVEVIAEVPRYRREEAPEPGPPTPDTPLPADAPEGPETGK